MSKRAGKGSDPLRNDRDRRKLIAFDAETWHALQLLGRDSLKSLQELADEAFADLLKKHDRPVSLKQALRQSARRAPANDPAPQRKKR
jgi:hypothetical protein